MLSVYFENIVTRQRKRISALPLLKATGASLMDGDSQALAAYNGGLWRIADDHFFVIGIETPVTIHFENGDHRSPEMGPYHPAWIIAGAVRAGPSQELAVARLDEASGNWHLYADRTFWSSVVFSPHGEA